MSAALKSEVLETRLRSSHPLSTGKRERRLTVVPTAPASPVTFPSLQPRDRPLWVNALVLGQRLSLVVAGISVATALAAYAATVDTNRRLTVATATLGQLQDQQQQLTTANAVFKNHLAQTAITAMNDGTLHPKDVIFLEATESPESAFKMPVTQPTEAIVPNRRFFPKGY
ncbi:MAG: hypothetical protein AAGG53_06030 [Cyanobacteria bacterium P01_H01_bin.152]